MRTLVGIVLVYSYYILGVPCLRFPVKSLHYLLEDASRPAQGVWALRTQVLNAGVYSKV